MVLDFLPVPGESSSDYLVNHLMPINVLATQMCLYPTFYIPNQPATPETPLDHITVSPVSIPIVLMPGDIQFSQVWKMSGQMISQDFCKKELLLKDPYGSWS